MTGAIIALAAAALAAALGAVGCGDASPAIAPSTSPTRPFAPVARFSEPQVTIPAHEGVAAVPHSFFGFSTEYWTLPVDELHAELYRRVISYLHVRGDGPFVLRIGGDSSDHTFYDPRHGPLPRWAFDLTPQFVDRTALIVRALKLRVILDMNLITGSPELAGAWAHFAESQMPHRSIIGFEIGNEPDLYDYAFWLSVTQGVRIATDALPRDISPADYAKDYDAYARVLGHVEPGVPLYAPALASPGSDRSFISTLLAASHPGLRVISGHRYPYSGCTDRDSPAYPTIGRLLSEAATAGMAQSVKPALVIAHHAGYPFELTEFNSITCGGLTGVSNTFATALWAPDAEFELFRAGIQGIHLHARQYAINDPFTFDATGMTARPLLYGLILFARTLGPDARFVPLHLESGAALHLKAWAVEVGRDTLHVLLINKGPNRLRVGLSLPARGAGTVERLLAPGPDAVSGETLGGRWLGRDARWHGKPVRERVRGHSHRYQVAMPAYSSALLSVRLAGGSLS
jgi:hypothetical protein